MRRFSPLSTSSSPAQAGDPVLPILVHWLRKMLDAPLSRGMTPWTGVRLLAPHLVRQFDNHAQLRPLLLLGEDVALFGRRKSALRRQAELIERDIFRRL